jgi:hypothetical protein
MTEVTGSLHCRHSTLLSAGTGVNVYRDSASETEVQMKWFHIPTMILATLLCSTVSADEPTLTIELDVSEVPHLKAWGDDAAELIARWYTRINNLIPAKGYSPPRKIVLKLKKSEEGVAATSGNVITVSSHWIEKHPDDIGLVVHELVHVIQAYPSADPWWLTEGIADYLRWAIYEGKPQSWFARPQQEKGYQQGYRIAAGFLLWLESDAAPGIVNKLNSAIRSGRYSDQIFVDATNRSLDELWKEYVGQQ